MPTPYSGPISLLDVANEFGGSTPHEINEYYGVAPGVPDVRETTISLNDFYAKAAFRNIYNSGQLSSSSSIRTQSIGVTSSIWYPSQIPFRFYIRYQKGSGFTGDFQFDNFYTYLLNGLIIRLDRFTSNNDGWQTVNSLNWNNPSQPPEGLWFDIPTSTAGYRFNRRASGNTPTGGTGISWPNGYIYAETSGSGNGRYFWARSARITTPNTNLLRNFEFQYGAFGSQIGNYSLYIDHH